MHRLSTQFTALIISLFISISALADAHYAVSGPRAWDYNPGPDPKTEMGRQLIDLYATLPDFEEMSDGISDDQFFRPAYGMMLTRTRFENDAVKILFIGQDATHVAEAAKQPGTSGFGGRVQSIGNFFGVDHGVATTNAYVSTIRKQYGTFDQIHVRVDDNGQAQVNISKIEKKLKDKTGKEYIETTYETRDGSYIDNELWVLTNDIRSEVVKKREQFWEWMIKNNPTKLSLILNFGGAARDAFAEFLIRRGFEIKTRKSLEQLKKIRIAESRLEYSGGNTAFPVPIDAKGKDIYEILMLENGEIERIMNLPQYARQKQTMEKKFGKGKFVADYSLPEMQQAALKSLLEAGQRGIDMMIFTGGGVNGSGMIHPAQLGGYNLAEAYLNGKKTVSLKGMKLSDGTVITRDIGFATSTHPTVLSKMEDREASESLRKSFEPLESLKKIGWKIEPDIDENGKKMVNLWDAKQSYSYGRADIGPWYFAFGDPDDRRAARADAVRLDTQVIVVGTRSPGGFDRDKIEVLKNNKPSETKNPKDLWTVRPRTGDARYEFDLGPGTDIAKELVSSLDSKTIFASKPGTKVMGSIDKNGKAIPSPTGKRDITFQINGIDAFNTKTHGDTGFFGFHRGDFKTAKTLIVADPMGLDDWITGRAMTGARGQYLNGLMHDLGYADEYLVIKTVPFGMDGATDVEWETIRTQTEKYRDTALSIALKNKNITEIYADGPIASKEVMRILKKLNRTDLTIVDIKRDGMKAEAGILEAGKTASSKIASLKSKRALGKKKDIARKHLPWWSRVWEGTGGDSVVDAEGKLRGGIRAVVAPNWAVNQDPELTPEMTESIKAMQQHLENMNVRIDTEPIASFLKRKNLEGRLN